jgi:hypothetical protein
MLLTRVADKVYTHLSALLHDKILCQKRADSEKSIENVISVRAVRSSQGHRKGETCTH